MLDAAAHAGSRRPRPSGCSRRDRWAHDLAWRASLERLVSVPTVNIEGLVAGYTGPGGKTILPHRAVAKLDLRLVPDMTFDGAVAALKAHLAKRGFGDIEVNPSGGYDPTSTPADAPVIRAQTRRLQAGRPRPDPVAAQRGLLSRATSSPASRSSCPRATSASATAAARTRPTSTSSSSPPTPRWRVGTAR